MSRSAFDEWAWIKPYWPLIKPYPWPFYDRDKPSGSSGSGPQSPDSGGIKPTSRPYFHEDAAGPLAEWNAYEDAAGRPAGHAERELLEVEAARQRDARDIQSVASSALYNTTALSNERSNRYTTREIRYITHEMG